MYEFLVVSWVALVGVEDDELGVVGHDERFPDIRICGASGFAIASSDVRGEGPGLARVSAGVEIYLGAGDVGGDGVACAEDGAGGERAHGHGEFVEEGLIAEAIVVGCVFYLSDLCPCGAGVSATVDGERDMWHIRTVVLPCC